MTSPTRSAAAALALGLLMTPDAQAAEPYMLGGGVHLGTFVVPGRYPISFPTQVENYNFIDEEDEFGGDPDSDEPKRDLDPDTDDPLFHTLEKVRTDIRFGGDFVYYLDGENRIGALLDLGFGKSYSDVAFMARYDRVMEKVDEFELLLGAGLGAGSMKFKGASEPEQLAASYFPLRVNAAGLYRAKTMAFQLSLFGQTNIPSNQRYTKMDGTEVESVGTPFAVFSYLSLGLEFTTMFGDFKPPAKKKKDKGGKGKK